MSQETEPENLGDAGQRIAEHLHAAGLQLHQARDLLLAVQPGTHDAAEKHVIAAMRAVDAALHHSSTLAVEIVRRRPPG